MPFAIITLVQSGTNELKGFCIDKETKEQFFWNKKDSIVPIEIMTNLDEIEYNGTMSGSPNNRVLKWHKIVQKELAVKDNIDKKNKTTYRSKNWSTFEETFSYIKNINPQDIEHILKSAESYISKFERGLTIEEKLSNDIVNWLNTEKDSNGYPLHVSKEKHKIINGIEKLILS